jgi:hypothetical protein
MRGDGHSGDFVDGIENDLDVKAPKSREWLITQIDERARAKGKAPPRLDPSRAIPGEFDVVTFITQVQKEAAANERVIIDTEGLTSDDLALLKAELAKAGLEDKVLIHE